MLSKHFFFLPEQKQIYFQSFYNSNGENFVLLLGEKKSTMCWLLNKWLITCSALSLRDKASLPFALTHYLKIKPRRFCCFLLTPFPCTKCPVYFSPVSQDARHCTIFRLAYFRLFPSPDIHEHVFAMGGGTEDIEHRPCNTRPKTRDTERRLGCCISVEYTKHL